MADQGAYSIQTSFLNSTDVVLTVESASKERGSKWMDGMEPTAGQTIGPGQSVDWGCSTDGTVAALEVNFSGLPPPPGQPLQLLATNTAGMGTCTPPKGPTLATNVKCVAHGAHYVFDVTIFANP